MEAAQITQEPGEDFNSAYINRLLEKNPTAMLQWLAQNLCDTESTVQESIAYAHAVDYAEDEAVKPTLLIGISILQKRFSTIQLVLKELRSKIEAENAQII